MTDRVVLVAAAVVALTSACSRRDPNFPPTAQDLQLLPVSQQASASTTQDQYSYSGFDQPARLVIRDDQAWATAWSTLMKPMVNPDAPPSVDFVNEMVVLAAMGQHNTGGYQITLREAASTADAVYLSVLESSPGTSCVTSEAFTQPVALARLGRFDGEVKFVENTESINCGP